MWILIAISTFAIFLLLKLVLRKNKFRQTVNGVKKMTLAVVKMYFLAFSETLSPKVPRFNSVVTAATKATGLFRRTYRNYLDHKYIHNY